MSNLFYPKEIIDSKFENNKLSFLVKWKEFKEPTWEPEKNIKHRTDLINAFYDMRMIQHLGLQKNGYIYCRVSSKKQSSYDQGHTSLDVQEQEIRRYCSQNKINVIDVIKEAYSAKNMDTMRGLQYICNIATSGQTIYVYDISRFSRNIHHSLNLLDDLNKRNISVYSISEKITYGDIHSRNQFRLQLCAATYYSDICSQKVKDSIDFRRARGDYIGTTPFGFMTKVDENTHVRSKIPCEEEMKIIEVIRNMKDKSNQEILDDLTEKDVKFRGGRDPTISSISRIQKRFDTDLKTSGKIVKKKKTKRGNTPY